MKLAFVIAILTFVFVNFANIHLAEALGNSSLYFNPASRTIDIGDSTTLDAVVDPGVTPHEVSSVSLRITYDETKLSLTAMECSAGFGTELYTNLPGVPDGTARIDCAVTGANPAVTVDTVAATFSFTSLDAVAESPVAFTVNSSIGADDELGVNVFDQDITTGRALVTVNELSDLAAPNFSINDGTSASPTKTDTINITVSDDSGVASRFYGYSSDSTCNASDTISTSFTSGTNFNITGNHSDYLCVKATDSSVNSNVGYQTVGQLHVDNAGPSFSVVNGTSASPTKTDTINITVSDDSGVASRFYGYSSDSTCNASDTISTSFTSGTNFNITGNHSDYLCAKATDSVSNETYQLVGQLHTDNTSPTIEEESAIPEISSNNSPSYVFSSTESGTITYSGGCTSATTSAAVGNNSVTISELTRGVNYTCTVQVSDTAGNQSSTLNLIFGVTYMADFNLDSAVDNLDYSFWHNYYDTDNGTADINSDNIVDNLDYGFLHSDYNKSF